MNSSFLHISSKTRVSTALLFVLFTLSSPTFSKAMQNSVKPTFKFEFSQGNPSQFADHSGPREIAHLRRVLYESREQQGWRFTLTGYAPHSCLNLRCPEVDILKSRVETITSQIGDSYKENRIRWQTSTTVSPNQIQLSMDSTAQEIKDGNCRGEVGIQSNLFPPNKSEKRQSSPQLLNWGASAPANDGTLIHYSVPEGTELSIQDAKNRIVRVSGSNSTRISADQLPIEIQIKNREASERIGPILRPWNGQSSPSTNTEKHCKIILNAW